MTIITIIMAVLVGWVILGTIVAIVLAFISIPLNLYRDVIKGEAPLPRRTPFSPKKWDR